MKVRTSVHDDVLVLKIQEPTLVRPPDWRALLAEGRVQPAHVALDLENVEFVSSLFWQSCVALARDLAARGGHLMLLNVSDQQRQVLSLVDGASALTFLQEGQSIGEEVVALRQESSRREGVNRSEKRMLWL